MSQTNLHSILTRIVSVGIRNEHDCEARRKIRLFNIFSYIGIICLLSLAVAAFAQNTPMLGYVDVIVAAMLASLVYYLHRSGNQAFCCFVAASVCKLFYCYLFATGGVHGTAFMWLFTYPTLAFFLVDLRIGSIFSLLLFLFSFFFLCYDLASPSVNIYNLDFGLRFVPSYLVVFFFSFLLERNRADAKRELKAKQEKLTELVVQLQEKEKLLENAHDKLEQRVALRTSELVTTNEKLRAEIELRRKLETELSRAQKMELLGILAGGIAHDLNNVLTGIVSYPDLLLIGRATDDPIRKPLERIKKSGQNAAAIVQDLLSLTRRGVIIKEILSLNEVITSYLQSPEYKNLIKAHPDVAVELHLDNSLQPIEGSLVHLQQIVMNLVMNGFEAIEGSGKIDISTRRENIAKALDRYEEIDAGSYSVMSIRDNGSGMSAEILDRLFEPFYSKKQLGRSGTGLGMTIVWTTIKDHDGFIDIDSSEGGGSTITVYFPVSKSNAPPVRLTQADNNYYAQGNNQLILIVDDVVEQREIGISIFQNLGYRVDAVASGEEAIDYIKKQPVDLVILDMSMPPGMDGLDTYQAMLTVAPKQKAIIVSGYSENERVREALELGAGGYLKKPYTIEQMSRLVDAELAKL